jgi:hypothetical protein
MNLKEYILQKAEKGYSFFTSKEAIESLGAGAKQAIWRAQTKEK